MVPRGRRIIRTHPIGRLLEENRNQKANRPKYSTKVYGFQFHTECIIEGFRRWQQHQPDASKPGVQSPAVQSRMMAMHDEIQAIWFYHFLEILFGTNL